MNDRLTYWPELVEVVEGAGAGGAEGGAELIEENCNVKRVQNFLY